MFHRYSNDPGEHTYEFNLEEATLTETPWFGNPELTWPHGYLSNSSDFVLCSAETKVCKKRSSVDPTDAWTTLASQSTYYHINGPSVAFQGHLWIIGGGVTSARSIESGLIFTPC